MPDIYRCKWCFDISFEPCLCPATLAIERLQQQLGECSVGFETGTRVMAEQKAEIERLRAALRTIAEMPMPEQDNMVASNMRRIAMEVVGKAP